MRTNQNAVSCVEDIAGAITEVLLAVADEGKSAKADSTAIADVFNAFETCNSLLDTAVGVSTGKVKVHLKKGKKGQDAEEEEEDEEMELEDELEDELEAESAEIAEIGGGDDEGIEIGGDFE